MVTAEDIRLRGLKFEPSQRLVDGSQDFAQNMICFTVNTLQRTMGRREKILLFTLKCVKMRQKASTSVNKQGSCALGAIL